MAKRKVKRADGRPECMELDEVDRKILTILQSDGKTALSEIARRLDMGNATIHERTKGLEREGYIDGYRAVLDPELLGQNEVGFVRVTTSAGRSSEVAERLVEVSAIQEIHELTGNADILLKIRVGDRQQLTTVLREIGQYDGIEHMATDIALRSVKENHAVTVEE
jgi:Lrp/AsnC family transcriptional regulator for asnA, asnC and gidA